MIRRASVSSYHFYRHANKFAGARPMLTTAVPAPAPVSEDDQYSLCFNLAADLLSKGQFSAARKVVSRLANCPSVRDAVSAVVLAGSRGLELEPGACNGLIRKLVDSGQFELAHDVYVHGVSGQGGELDSDTDNSVFVCLVKLGKFEEARERFDVVVARGDVRCRNACEGLVLELCRQGRFLEAFDCFVRVSDSGLVMDPTVYDVLIGGLCDMGRMDEARKMFVDLCERSGLMPTFHLFKCLFFGYCKKGLTSEAEKIFGQMEEEFGRLGDKVMYTSLINNYCREGNVGMAMGFLGRMKKTGCEQDSYTLKTLVHGYVRMGLFDKARELLRYLHKKGELDDVAFHFKLTMDCKEGKLEFKPLFDFMNMHSLVPGVHYYTTLMAALYKTNNMAEIRELLEHMKHNMVIPDHVFFLILRKIVRQGHPLEGCLALLRFILENGTLGPPLQSTSPPPQNLEQEIEHLLEEIAARNLYLASVGYAIYISALCEEGRTDIASACLLKMKDVGCRPLVFTFNSLINWYCLNGLFEVVQLLIDFMQEENIVPDSATYLIRIKGYCRRMDPDAAFSLVREMGTWGLRPSVAMYDLIIGCLGRMDRMSEAETLFDEMVDSGIKPDGTIYTTMINAYGRMGKAKEAQFLFEDMVKNSVSPSCHSYTALISGLVKGKKIVEACEYLQRMLHDDFRPNIVLFTTLISNFLRKREFVYAYRLVNIVDTNGIGYDEKFNATLASGIYKVIRRTKKRRYVPNKPYSSAKERLLCLLGEGTDLSIIRPTYSFERLECIAMKLVEKIKEDKFDLFLYNVSISGFCWANKVKYAHCQFGVMLKDGIQPNEVTFTILIDDHIRNGRTNNAVALFNKMSAYGCTPDKITCNSLLNGLCGAGRGVDALCLLYAMHKRGFPPQKLAYQRIIHCLCAGGFGIPAFKVLEEMDRDGYCPRLFTINKLSSVLLQGNNLREYSVLVDIMGRHENIIYALAKRSRSRSFSDQRETDFYG